MRKEDGGRTSEGTSRGRTWGARAERLLGLVATGSRLAPTVLVVAASSWVLGTPSRSLAQSTRPLFSEDFETGLDGWRFPYGSGHELVETGSPQGTALHMAVESLPVYALIEGSETWGDVRVEGKVLFPTDDHAYLGFIYHYVDDGRRIDFGSAYIKGNDGYVQANEHHDTNVGRTVYPELRTHLTGESEVRPGVWAEFALEVVGDAAHLYVGDMARPVMTLAASARAEGGIGFKPRNPGAPVLIDDIRVESIEELTWRGRPVPDVPYRRSDFLTEWSVLGPLTSYVDEVERGGRPDQLRIENDERAVTWQPYPADHRGAVVTARVVEYRRERRVAYFRARFTVTAETGSALHVSSADDIAVWVDGVFEGFASGSGAAWFDAPLNEDRPRIRLSDGLDAGDHEVVVRVVGGVYATGGFYAWLADPS